MKAEAILEHGSFSALCTKECGLSDSFVAGAIRVATELSREAALELGSQRRALAFLDLARATPEDDTATDLSRGGLSRGGVKLLRGASARKVEAAAKALRAQNVVKTGAKSGGKRRGNTTAAQERAEAARLERGLQTAAVGATVHAVATRPGERATFTFARIPAEAFALLARLLRKR